MHNLYKLPKDKKNEARWKGLSFSLILRKEPPTKKQEGPSWCSLITKSSSKQTKFICVEQRQQAYLVTLPPFTQLTLLRHHSDHHADSRIHEGLPIYHPEKNFVSFKLLAKGNDITLDVLHL